MTRKRVHWGQTPFRVNDDPEIGQLYADLTNNGVRLTQLWVIFRVQLTDFLVIDGVWPQWTLSELSLTPAFLECGSYSQGRRQGVCLGGGKMSRERFFFFFFFFFCASPAQRVGGGGVGGTPTHFFFRLQKISNKIS